MESNQTENNLFFCKNCEGYGWISSPGDSCPGCQGKGFYLIIRGVKVGFAQKLRGIPPFIRKTLRLFNFLIEMTVWALAIFCLSIGAFALMESLKSHQELIFNFHLFFDIFFAGIATAPFWLGISLIIILIFHRLVYLSRKPINLKVKAYRYLLSETPNHKDKVEKVDISESFSKPMIKILRDALDLAHSRGDEPNISHLFYSLLKSKNIFQVFQVLEIPIEDFLKDFNQKVGENSSKSKTQGLNYDYKRIIINAFLNAIETESELVREEHILMTITEEEKFKSILYKYKVHSEDFYNIILWLKYRKLDTSKFLSKGSFKKPRHHIMNRSWSAVQTKTLDLFSTDVTDYARSGLLLPLVNRKDEMRMLIRVLQRSTQNNALLIGQEDSGRDSIVRGLARRMIKNKVPGKLFDKRIVKLNLGALGSGSKGDGSVLKTRLEIIINEVLRTKNVILYIPNLHELAKIQSFANMDVLSFLTPVFSNQAIQVIGSTTPEYYHEYIEKRGSFAGSFDNIKIKELDKDQALKVLSIQVPILEKSNGVTITYKAAKQAIENSDKFITDKLLPQKAIDILAEAVVRAKNTKGTTLVTENEVLEVFSEKTGIPVTNIGQNEAQKLLNLETKMQESVIGQEKAVEQTARAIRRMRVRIGEEERPIAVFMFLGPTGVGKTELAKTIAKNFFGSRDRMIRIDMSEFQSPYDLERLIGDSHGQVDGLLTESVRKSPFSLVLLDEFEKANPKIWDLFLQVFDDGRITDGQGKVINFTNTIIIATSNVGSKMILQALEQGVSVDQLKNELKNQLLQFFRPEFLNRFDDIITFNALSREDIKGIIKIEIKNLNKRLERSHGIFIELTEDALDYLAEIGHSPEFGARFLKRTIREKIEDSIVTGLLDGSYTHGNKVVVDRGMLS